LADYKLTKQLQNIIRERKIYWTLSSVNFILQKSDNTVDVHIYNVVVYSYIQYQ
jgi:hypothetical protein